MLNEPSKIKRFGSIFISNLPKIIQNHKQSYIFFLRKYCIRYQYHDYNTILQKNIDWYWFKVYSPSHSIQGSHTFQMSEEIQGYFKVNSGVNNTFSKVFLDNCFYFIIPISSNFSHLFQYCWSMLQAKCSTKTVKMARSRG